MELTSVLNYITFAICYIILQFLAYIGLNVFLNGKKFEGFVTFAMFQALSYHLWVCKNFVLG